MCVWVNLLTLSTKSLNSCYCHFLLGPVVKRLNNVRVTIVQVHHDVLVSSMLKKKENKVGSVETGYWTGLLPVGECLRGKCQQAANGDFILLGSPGTTRQLGGWMVQEDVWARLCLTKDRNVGIRQGVLQNFHQMGRWNLFYTSLCASFWRNVRDARRNPLNNLLSVYSHLIVSHLTTCQSSELLTFEASCCFRPIH